MPVDPELRELHIDIPAQPHALVRSTCLGMSAWRDLAQRRRRWRAAALHGRARLAGKWPRRTPR